MQNTLAVISLQRILKNLTAVQSKTSVPVMAVVKDDAYGHGAEKVSLFLEPYVCGFAVATLQEGICLRSAGISKDILVLTPPLSEADAFLCAAHDLSETVVSEESLKFLQKAGEVLGKVPRAHLKVNTGMNRYGAPPEEAGRLSKLALSFGVELSGVFSHLYAPEDKGARKAQKQKFLFAADKVKEVFPSVMRHLASTGGILAGEEYHFDLVRSGIALYGYLPSSFEGALKVRPSMRVYAPVAQTFSFLGGGLCYGHAEREYSALSTLRLGYGDGFFRNGNLGEVPLCMDACVREGALKAGKMQLIFKDAREYAKECGTIVYDVLVRVGQKAEKIYV